MSDFDAVLERLVTDPGFAAALAADSSSALAGYRLDADEQALLCRQVSCDAGGNSAVEQRATKSSTFGLFAPVAAVAESLVAGFGASATAGLGPSATAGMGPSATAGLGSAPGGWGGSMQTGPRAGLGGPVAVDGLGGRSAVEGLGGRPAAEGLGDAARAGLGERGTVYSSSVRPALAQPEEIAPPEGYRNRVDVDGDGTWDRATYRGRADGGVDILVDRNGDGRTDFVGHDVDADRTVDSADYDKDHDGFFEKRMYDDNGDGLLDRTVRRVRR
jgi:hypothetical protein